MHIKEKQAPVEIRTSHESSNASTVSVSQDNNMFHLTSIHSRHSLLGQKNRRAISLMPALSYTMHQAKRCGKVFRKWHLKTHNSKLQGCTCSMVSTLQTQNTKNWVCHSSRCSFRISVCSLQTGNPLLTIMDRHNKSDSNSQETYCLLPNSSSS